MTEFELPHFHDENESAERLCEHIRETEGFGEVADVFSQLSDITRVRIFWLLCHCEECVMNISAMVGMSSPAVSHHLKCLKQSGLLVCRRSNKEVYYKAADSEECRLLHIMIEKMLEMKCPDELPDDSCAHNTECGGFTDEQIETAHKVHEYLTAHINERHTIESLSRKFLINQTTLKNVFRAVYGNSLASHIKEHRMEEAAKLLAEGKLSIAEVSSRVGYESQSKFTAAFKAAYGVLPTEYKNK